MESVAGVEELFEREFRPLVRALGVAFGAEAAADAVQEAFIAADRRWSRVGRYDDPAAWIRRVAVNRLLNGVRDRRRRTEILATVRPAAICMLDAADLDLRAAVAALPARMRAVLCLYYLADLSVAAVATALEVSEGTVKSTLHDGRSRLRTALEVPDG